MDQKSLDQLYTCDGQLIKLANIVDQYFPIRILQGERGMIEQNELFAKKLTKVRWPKSKHNVHEIDKRMGRKAQAFDWFPLKAKQFPDPINRPKTYAKELAMWYMGVAALKIAAALHNIPIRSGADWDNDWDILENEFDDLGHIELI